MNPTNIVQVKIAASSIIIWLRDPGEASLEITNTMLDFKELVRFGISMYVGGALLSIAFVGNKYIRYSYTSEPHCWFLLLVTV